MENRDEQIAAQKRAMFLEKEEKEKKEILEKESAESIFDGKIHIYEKEVNYVRKKFNEYGISILVPDSFEEMADEDKNAIYPYGKAPKHVLAGEAAPYQISLNKTDNIVPDDGIPKFVKLAKEVTERIGPQAKVLSAYSIKKDDHNVGLMEIATMGLDGPVYNMQFYVSLSDQKIVIGALTCQSKRFNRMQSIMMETVESIIFEERVENNE